MSLLIALIIGCNQEQTTTIIQDQASANQAEQRDQAVEAHYVAIQSIYSMYVGVDICYGEAEYDYLITYTDIN